MMMMMMMMTGIFTYGTNTYRYSFRRYSVRTPSSSSSSSARLTEHLIMSCEPRFLIPVWRLLCSLGISTDGSLVFVWQEVASRLVNICIILFLCSLSTIRVAQCTIWVWSSGSWEEFSLELGRLPEIIMIFSYCILSPLPTSFSSRCWQASSPSRRSSPCWSRLGCWWCWWWCWWLWWWWYWWWCWCRQHCRLSICEYR